MYTLEMATAFKSIVPPNKFGLTVLENPDFLTLVVDPKDLENLADGEIELIVKYINDVKNMFPNITPSQLTDLLNSGVDIGKLLNQNNNKFLIFQKVIQIPS